MFIADLHIHSKYARATSKECVPEFLDLWAGKKGIDLLGTGDLTHPAWRDELKEKLEPDDSGLYRLKKEYRMDSPIKGHTTKFVLTGEISSIYKKNGRVRKIHNVVIFPDMDAADRFSQRLEGLGANIRSDGRPILGIDSRDLLEMALDADERAIFIPAHIWTPHFSLFGEYSGFDAIEECFEDLTCHIHALETGLSSDPPMNRMVSALDKYMLVSNSDAHSPSNLAREANIFNCGLNYDDIYDALTGKDENKFYGTLEFYPEEGKYHFDGHRKCGISMTPSETVKNNGICPVCGGRITVGVLHRVEELADRDENYTAVDDKPFERIVPLTEVIASSMGMSSGSVKVKRKYEELLAELGPELKIIREIPIDMIEKKAGPLVARGIENLRNGKVEAVAGYDGEYGKISVLTAKDRDSIEGQLKLFEFEEGDKGKKAERKRLEKTGKAEDPEISRPGTSTADQNAVKNTAAGTEERLGLNEEQWSAASSRERVTAVIAGPGTGKTKTLICRIALLINEYGADPSKITAVTFTNKASRELRERLDAMLGDKRRAAKVNIGTFHSLCLKKIKNAQIISQAEALETAQRIALAEGEKISSSAFINSVSRRKNGMDDTGISDELFELYSAELKEKGLMDFDDILISALDMDMDTPYLLVDEFQDINDLQYSLIRKWGERAESLFIIGDPNQSIYGFRGSDSSCFERFEEDFSPVKVIRLKQNYRSTPEILKCSETVMGENTSAGGLEANRKSGGMIRSVTADTPFAEAVFIAKEINRMAGGIDMTYTDGGLKKRRETGIRGFSDIAVLYRTNRQADIIEECLKKEGIPYKVSGRERYLRDKNVIEAVGWLKTLPKNKKPSAAVAEYISEKGLEQSPEMGRLYSAAVMYKNMNDFLNDIIIGTEGDGTRSGAREKVNDCVTLMTFHASKGLEFPVVFLAGINDGTVPYIRYDGQCDMDEERRLFYVGMTRAGDELIITAGNGRSRFMSALPKKFVAAEKAGELKRPAARQLTLF